MRYLKFILIVLLFLTPINAISSLDKSSREPPLIESKEVRKDKQRYAESKSILMKSYSFIEELNILMMELDKVVYNKDINDEDYYPMLLSVHEVRNILYLLDHCVTISVNIVHIKSDSYELFLGFGYVKVDKLMTLINYGKTTIRVNFNFINNKDFIKKSKRVLEVVDKVQEIEVEFFIRLAN